MRSATGAISRRLSDGSVDSAEALDVDDLRPSQPADPGEWHCGGGAGRHHNRRTDAPMQPPRRGRGCARTSSGSGQSVHAPVRATRRRATSERHSYRPTPTRATCRSSASLRASSWRTLSAGRADEEEVGSRGLVARYPQLPVPPAPRTHRSADVRPRPVVMRISQSLLRSDR